jgi:hypothetical protein
MIFKSKIFANQQKKTNRWKKIKKIAKKSDDKKT